MAIFLFAFALWIPIGIFSLVLFALGYWHLGRERRKRLKARAAESLQRAEARQLELQRAGHAHLYRAEACPHCGYAIDLTGLPVTAQVWCPNCEALATRPGGAAPAPRDEKHFRICPACSLYSAPRTFKFGYVIFLVFVAVGKRGEVECCHACFRPKAREMFLLNLITVATAPIGLWQLEWAWLGGSWRSQAFKELDAANTCSHRQQWHAALQLYHAMLQRVPVSAGLKYNCGVTCLRAGDYARAEQYFRAALADCSNFAPAQVAFTAMRQPARAA